MKILAFGDIHFHHTHRFSHITPDGFSIRELEHLHCADDIIRIGKEENIDRVIFLGDMIGPVGDNLSTQTLAAVSLFIDKIRKEFPFDIIVGNHDVSSYLNNTYSHKLIPFKYWDNVNVYDTPIEVDNFIYMPYCNSDDFAETFLQTIKDKQNKVIFSHLELKGINLGNGIETKHGVELDTLKQFKMTLQGHYHSGGNYAKNIYVSGSTQRLSFKDPGKSKNNILIYDTDTNKIERKSFTCPDWLTFDDDTIDNVLNVSNDNYVKIDITSDLLLTDKILNKINQMKGKDIHIDLTRLKLDKHITESIDNNTKEDESSVLTQFIEKTDNDETEKRALIEEGLRLLKIAKV